MGKNFNNIFERIIMALPFNSLDETQRSRMACTFASLMLHDEGIELNNTNLKKVIDAAGVTVAPYWPMLFAQALSGKDLGSFLNVSGGSAPVQQSGGGGGAPAPGDAPKEEAKPEEEEEEEDMDLGDLFG